MIGPLTHNQRRQRDAGQWPKWKASFLDHRLRFDAGPTPEWHVPCRFQNSRPRARTALPNRESLSCDRRPHAPSISRSQMYDEQPDCWLGSRPPTCSGVFASVGGARSNPGSVRRACSTCSTGSVVFDRVGWLRRNSGSAMRLPSPSSNVIGKPLLTCFQRPPVQIINSLPFAL